MVEEMPIHPTLFRFMSVLNDSILQHTETVIAQTDSGTFLKRKQSRAQAYLQETATQMETNYRRGLLSATAVLQHAADHYTDRIVEEVMHNNALLTNAENGENGEDDDDDTIDERQRAIDQDSELEDNDPDNWISTTWPEIEAKSITSRTPLLPEEDPSKVCCIVCSICYSAPDVMTILTSCKHAFCKTCIEQMNDCPHDRIPIDRKVEVFLSSFIIVRKEDAQNNFGITEQQMQQADERNGQRVADQTEAERFREMMEEALAEDMRQQQLQAEYNEILDNIPRPYSQRLTSTSTDRSRSSGSSDTSTSSTDTSGTSSQHNRVNRLRRLRNPPSTITSQPTTANENNDNMWTTSRMVRTNGEDSITGQSTMHNNEQRRYMTRGSRTNATAQTATRNDNENEPETQESDEDIIPATQQ